MVFHSRSPLHCSQFSPSLDEAPRDSEQKESGPLGLVPLTSLKCRKESADFGVSSFLNGISQSSNSCDLPMPFQSMTLNGGPTRPPAVSAKYLSTSPAVRSCFSKCSALR